VERGAVGLIRGEAPEWARAGYGYGYGDGYGYGPGYGDGYGYGSGYGDGYGYGSGYGDGYGSGSGYGSHVVTCSPCDITVTVSDLIRHAACGSGVSVFAATFPDGAVWPRDADKARVAGLDVSWAEAKLGLPRPVP
jgi:hypothetical protein